MVSVVDETEERLVRPGELSLDDAVVLVAVVLIPLVDLDGEVTVVPEDRHRKMFYTQRIRYTLLTTKRTTFAYCQTTKSISAGRRSL